MPRYQERCLAYTTCAKTVEFITPGAFSWTVPANVTRATFEIWGGGGGGGAKCCCNCYHTGPGGAPGGFAKVAITVAPGAAYAICVGAGGMQCVGGTCGNHWCCYGNPGCTTYVTGAGLSNFCATGGEGGNNSCFYYCGCFITSGASYGADYVICSGAGMVGGTSDSNYMSWHTAGGGAWSAGGLNFVQETCNGCWIAPAGMFPGGGGLTSANSICCCCSQAGVGANGMVKIYY